MTRELDIDGEFLSVCSEYGVVSLRDTYGDPNIEIRLYEHEHIVSLRDFLNNIIDEGGE